MASRDESESGGRSCLAIAVSVGLVLLVIFVLYVLYLGYQSDWFTVG